MEEYSAVRLTSSAYEKEGIFKGDIGFILENWLEGHYLVEFSDANTGITIYLGSFPEADLELIQE